ncbi:hypothetical protein [Alloalcanivorax profundimaris]|uniref:hypothetical protein n=1 Tax=Alloalcanivorax profundimaris TaxID=2735259 RepID=UPI00188884A8|nr:hypothetical protein [Alloalcanivorax profundimaris]MBF1801154.1 hypothetical protein [Alloalcanivorax profundimaris]
MMKVVKRVFVAFLLSVSSHSFADQVWLDQDLMVEDVVVYSQYDKNVMTVRVSSNEPLSVGCAPTDTHGIFSYWTSADFNGAAKTRVATLLAAQAQRLPIRILVDVGNCNTYGGWSAYGEPFGLGVAFYGVRVIRE